ncbi:MAG: N-acetyltransferase family protein [Ilumatobacteraceae bacterium]
MSTTPLEQLTVRRATVADAQTIVALYEGLSPQSRHTRFFLPIPRLTSSLRQQIADVDRANIWLAFDGDTCVGEARIAPSARQSCADLAVTVADSYQHRGIGEHLARVAVAEHLQTGECVEFSILPTNTAATRLARRNHLHLHLDSGTVEGRIHSRRQSQHA